MSDVAAVIQAVSDALVCSSDLEHGPHDDEARFCIRCGKPLERFADAMGDLANLRFAMQNFVLEHEDTRDGYIRVPEHIAARMLEVAEMAAPTGANH